MKTFALALGGGGARGLAHIPVIEALDELGVKPTAIAGTSIGALVGAAYAAGMHGKDIRRHVIALAHDAVNDGKNLRLVVFQDLAERRLIALLRTAHQRAFRGALIIHSSIRRYLGLQGS